MRVTMPSTVRLNVAAMIVMAPASHATMRMAAATVRVPVVPVIMTVIITVDGMRMSTTMRVSASAVRMAVAAEYAHASEVDGETDAAKHYDLVGVRNQIAAIERTEPSQLFDSFEDDGEARRDQEATIAERADNFGTFPPKRHGRSGLSEGELRHAVTADQGRDVGDHVKRVSKHGQRAGHDADDNFSDQVGSGEHKHEGKLARGLLRGCVQTPAGSHISIEVLPPLPALRRLRCMRAVVSIVRTAVRMSMRVSMRVSMPGIGVTMPRTGSWREGAVRVAMRLQVGQVRQVMHVRVSQQSILEVRHPLALFRPRSPRGRQRGVAKIRPPLSKPDLGSEAAGGKQRETH